MAEPILNIDGKKLLNALKSGDRQGYVLFPEIRNRRNWERVKAHPTASRMLNELLNYAEGIANAGIPELLFTSFIEFSKTGKRLNYEKTYFESKKQLHALIMAELAEGSGRYISAIQDRLWKWCDTYTWELPAHVPLSPDAVRSAGGAGADVTVALFSAETAFYFSEILSLLESRLDPILVYRLRSEIERRVVKPFTERTYGWEKLTNNWSAVCAGAVGCAAIYGISDSVVLASILQRAANAMECFLSGFDSDGVTPEGLSYWNYGFSFFVYFSELLKERTCGDADLLHCHDKLRRIAELPLYLQFPDGHMVNFSDAPGFRWEGDYGLLCRLSEAFGIDGFRLPWSQSIFQDHTSKWAAMARNLFWGLDKTPDDVKRIVSRTGLFYFPESQWLIDRRLLPLSTRAPYNTCDLPINACSPSINTCSQSTTCCKSAEPAAIASQETFCAFAAKGGHNGESHNHNDLGHFILFFDGDILFADLGAPEYSKKYFGAERYDILHASSRGHSVPLINGKEQAPGTGHSARVSDWGEENGSVRFCLDLTGAYSIAELSRFERKFQWDFRQLSLDISDKFVFSKPGNHVQEAFITVAEPILAGPGEIRIKGKSHMATLLFDKEAKAGITLEEFTDHHGRPSAAYRILVDMDTAGTGMEMNLRIEIQ